MPRSNPSRQTLRPHLSVQKEQPKRLYNHRFYSDQHRRVCESTSQLKQNHRSTKSRPVDLPAQQIRAINLDHVRAPFSRHGPHVYVRAILEPDHTFLTRLCAQTRWGVVVVEEVVHAAAVDVDVVAVDEPGAPGACAVGQRAVGKGWVGKT